MASRKTKFLRRNNEEKVKARQRALDEVWSSLDFDTRSWICEMDKQYNTEEAKKQKTEDPDKIYVEADIYVFIEDRDHDDKSL